MILLTAFISKYLLNDININTFTISVLLLDCLQANLQA